MARLLSPIKAGSLTLSNRLVMTPMATSKAESDGKVSEEILDYYAEKSQGGYISLIIIEHSFIALEGKASPQQLSIAEDNVIPNLNKLAQVIQGNGSKCMMQLNHAGSATSAEYTGMPPVGPSAVPNPRRGSIPHELTHEGIKGVINAFMAAAHRARVAGFDGVEIHSAHGYLLNQFFSPLTNKRTDEYGGDVFNRIRIHLEVIEAVRSEVGEEYPILLRLGASDFAEGGTTIEDSLIASQEFEKAGVNILDISGGFSGYSVPGLTGQGYFSHLSEAIKNVVSIPVILTGGVTEALAAEKLLAEGKADLIGVGRALLHNSKWAEQATNSLR
jgi:2,4-dienoyl-CoA reductase-like NADH-dependent reductase (Old Yellow Enzyme family)